MKSFQGYVLDLDGVLYKGSRPIPGARQLLKALRKKHAEICFLSNASFHSRKAIARKLASLGMPCKPSEVINSGYAAAQYILKTYGKCKVFILGEGDLAKEVRGAGLEVGKQNARVVLVGLDRHINYRKLTHALYLLRSGAVFLACNADATYPSEKGIMPGAGAMIGAVQNSSGKKPKIIGKPSSFMMKLCLKLMGLRAQQVAVIGDRLDTDILMANKAGAYSILVLTGVTSSKIAGQAKGASKPDLVVRDLVRLRKLL
ncbi:hypothetical protein DRN67_02685 [Candidatus Micrarchaeota archaeon]|nr:MAG: hypothetical protein DRN67_02685 [Candidatus Micrarchaeota archaeon]